MKRFFAVENLVQSPKWFWSFVISSAICVLVYLVHTSISEAQPGNIWGLSYGWAASILMVGSALFALRRRNMSAASKYGLGKSHTWLQFHLYGGTIFLLLVFMHCGFHLPKGPSNWWLWILSIWVTFSGIIGVVLQKWVPKILTSALSIEAVYERIPELVNQMRERAEKMIESCTDPIRDFYRQNISLALVTTQPRLIYCFDITGGIQSRIKQFDYLRRFLSSEEKETLDHLEALYKSKLELDAQYTLQKALRWWLYTHVPSSLLLIALLILHLYAVLYY